MRENIVQIYSKLFFDLVDRKEIDTVYEEFSIISSILTTKGIFSFFEFQSISFETKMKIFEKYFHSKCSDLVYHFFVLVIKKNRVSLLNFIVEDVKKRIDDYKNVQKIYIKSSNKIDEDCLEEIKAIMKKKLKQNIELEFIYDKKINQGFILKFRDYFIDCSLRGRLNHIKDYLLNLKVDFQKELFYEN